MLRCLLCLTFGLALLAFAGDRTEKQTLAEVNAALRAGHPEQAAELIAQYLSIRPAESSAFEEAHGRSLLQLKRNDEAAYHFGLALKLAGDDEAQTSALIALLKLADPLYPTRARLMGEIATNLRKSSEELVVLGHLERALAILEPLEPIAAGEERRKIAELAATLRGKSQRVDLDRGSGAAGQGGARPQVNLAGKHYEIQANLEPEKAEQVRDVMDDIFTSYVQIFMEGDAARVAPRNPTIRVLASREEMLKCWDVDGRAPPAGLGGWWAASEWTVYCYDTRADYGSLDVMLTTLYHEASHHFMDMVTRGGHVPAWINEGTGTFFEGATAMADRRVLWPDAARERLHGLQTLLKGGGGPTLEQVVAYNEPGSYVVEYYYFGWGLVYYLQQYEDPTSLEYIFRPLYAKYRDASAEPGIEPLALFEQIFLAPGAPGGSTEFDAWAANWREWIENRVYPMHFGERERVRESRLDQAKKYLEAADRAKTDTAVKLPEDELLRRAFAQLEFVRTRIDGERALDPDLVLQEADLLDRMGRSTSTAALLEQVLAAANAGGVTLDPDRYEELDKRLTKLDAKNKPLQLAKGRQRSYATRVLKLLDDYQSKPLPMTLTTYEFAHSLARALSSKPLEQAAEKLRAKARESGIFPRTLYRIGGPDGAWLKTGAQADEVFEVGETTIALSSARPAGRLFTKVALSGEYELRCTLGRAGEVSPDTLQGLIFSGSPMSTWHVAAIDGEGQLVLRSFERNGSERALKTVKLEPALAMDERPTFSVRVHQDRRVVFKIGERAPIEITLDEQLPQPCHIGVFAKHGRTELNSTMLEVFP